MSWKFGLRLIASLAMVGLLAACETAELVPLDTMNARQGDIRIRASAHPRTPSREGRRRIEILARSSQNDGPYVSLDAAAAREAPALERRLADLLATRVCGGKPVLTQHHRTVGNYGRNQFSNLIYECPD